MKRALDDAVDSSRSSPTRLIRNLVGIFFLNETLSQSNAGRTITRHSTKTFLQHATVSYFTTVF